MQLDELRKKADLLDAEIVRLISERACVAQEIGHTKKSQNAPIYAPDREEIVYGNVAAANKGPLPDSVLRSVYREIISGCRALETPLGVAYLGPEGTFSQAAALSNFGDAATYVPLGTIDETFGEVERGRADYAVVPVENSTGGGIHETLTRFLTSPLQVCAEIVTEIHHALMAACPLDEVKRVYSRGQVLGQTRRWLQTHLPQAEQMAVSSTSLAAQRAANEPGTAAIGNSRLADVHGLNVLSDRIEDYAHNVTRFFVLGQHMSEPTGDDKTAVLCSVKDKVGALHDLLASFKGHGINMTKIESFPSPDTAWRYYFFIDFVGHPAEKKNREALQQMEEQCVSFKILGAFPRCRG
jgi:chorismate mutase/prephenate dehydratase